MSINVIVELVEADEPDIATAKGYLQPLIAEILSLVQRFVQHLSRPAASKSSFRLVFVVVRVAGAPNRTPRLIKDSNYCPYISLVDGHHSRVKLMKTHLRSERCCYERYTTHAVPTALHVELLVQIESKNSRWSPSL